MRGDRRFGDECFRGFGRIVIDVDTESSLCSIYRRRFVDSCANWRCIDINLDLHKSMGNLNLSTVVNPWL